MERLRTEVQKVMMNELKRANEKFPLFNSAHEGISVIREELLEAYEELDALTDITYDTEQAVFKDKPNKDIHAIARQGAIAAICGACELIQVAAMYDKFRTSIDQKAAEDARKSEFMNIPQEEINRICEENCEEVRHVEIRRSGPIGEKRVMRKVSPETAKKLFRILAELEDEEDEE